MDAPRRRLSQFQHLGHGWGSEGFSPYSPRFGERSGTSFSRQLGRDPHQVLILFPETEGPSGPSHLGVSWTWVGTPTRGLSEAEHALCFLSSEWFQVFLVKASLIQIHPKCNWSGQKLTLAAALTCQVVRAGVFLAGAHRCRDWPHGRLQVPLCLRCRRRSGSALRTRLQSLPVCS